VSVSWRCILRGRVACIGSAASRPFRIPAQSGGRKPHGHGRVPPHPCRTAVMHNPLTAIVLWLEERLQVRRLFEATAGHKVPASTNSWFYVLGSGTLLCFVIQVVTGICLAFVYVPSTDQAWTSLQYLNHQQALGWFLRAVHNWGSMFM